MGGHYRSDPEDEKEEEIHLFFSAQGIITS
jgi:hypothetical protein